MHYLTHAHQTALLEFLRQRTLGSSSLQVARSVNRDELLEHMQTVDGNVNVVTAAVQSLKADDQRLTNEYTENQTLHQTTSQQVSSLMKSLEEQTVFVDTIGANQRSCHASILSMQQTLESSSASAHDGTMIWRITEIKRKMG